MYVSQQRSNFQAMGWEALLCHEKLPGKKPPKTHLQVTFPDVSMIHPCGLTVFQIDSATVTSLCCVSSSVPSVAETQQACLLSEEATTRRQFVRQTLILWVLRRFLNWFIVNLAMWNLLWEGPTIPVGLTVVFVFCWQLIYTKNLKWWEFPTH